MLRKWKLARRNLTYGDRTLVMGVLNVTPDSFSDGGLFLSRGQAVEHAKQMVAEGADIIDIGGESTRPGSDFVSAEDELQRVIPVIETLAGRINVPISIDTTKQTVARTALQAGAEIVNDISGLRFEPELAGEVAAANAGLLLMHSRGVPKDMQQMPWAEDILRDVIDGLNQGVSIAEQHGVRRDGIAIDPGIGFGKNVEQNLALIANLGKLAEALPDFPLLIGTSRKSFIGKLLDGAPANQRVHGTIASVVAAVLNGAHVVRVHDVGQTREALKITEAIRRAKSAELVIS